MKSANTSGVDTGGEYQSESSLNSCQANVENCSSRSRSSGLMARSATWRLHASPTFSSVISMLLSFLGRPCYLARGFRISFNASPMMFQQKIIIQTTMIGARSCSG